MSNLRRIATCSLTAALRKNRYPELQHLHSPGDPLHVVEFYQDDSLIIESVATLSAKALDAGDSVLLIATESHLKEIERRIAASGFARSNRCMTLDAHATLSRLMIDGSPDQTRFDDVIGGMVDTAYAQSTHGFVFAFGEMVALLCDAGNADGALKLEQLWNSLAKRRRFSLYCAYPLDSFRRPLNLDFLTQICEEHSLTIPSAL